MEIVLPTSQDRHNPQTCLTNRSGTPAHEHTARAQENGTLFPVFLYTYFNRRKYPGLEYTCRKCDMFHKQTRVERISSFKFLSMFRAITPVRPISTLQKREQGEGDREKFGGTRTRTRTPDIATDHTYHNPPYRNLKFICYPPSLS